MIEKKYNKIISIFFFFLISCSIVPAIGAGDSSGNIQNIDASNWRQISLAIYDDNGNLKIDIKLLRDMDWINKTGAHAGGSIWLELPEMGIQGNALVNAIEPTEIIPTNGIVTGRFISVSSNVLQLRFTNSDEVLQPTFSHPLYSTDRNAWIRAGELHTGEHIKTQTGVVTINSIESLSSAYTVYNLEIYGTMHSYYVTHCDILGHNSEAMGCGTNSFLNIKTAPEKTDPRLWNRITQFITRKQSEPPQEYFTYRAITKSEVLTGKPVADGIAVTFRKELPRGTKPAFTSKDWAHGWGTSYLWKDLPPDEEVYIGTFVTKNKPPVSILHNQNPDFPMYHGRTVLIPKNAKPISVEPLDWRFRIRNQELIEMLEPNYYGQDGFTRIFPRSTKSRD